MSENNNRQNNTLNEAQFRKAVDNLRQLILKDTKLSKFRHDDNYLTRYLHCTDFKTEDAFKKLQNYFDLIYENQDWFATIPPLDKKEQIERNDKAVFREKDKSGRAILLVKLGRIDAVNSCPSEQSQIFDMFLESFMDDPRTQATGVSVIVDMKDFSLRLFRWLTPATIKLTAAKVDLYPFKNLILHVVNTNFLINAVIKLIWPFLNERLRAMFKFHYDDWPALHEYIDPKILPMEYGGTGSDLDFEKTNQRLFDLNDEIFTKLKCQKLRFN